MSGSRRVAFDQPTFATDAAMPDPAAPSVDFIISRAGENATFAAQIAVILKRAGYTVLLQQWDMVNRSFMDCIHEALAGGARMVALLSRSYLETDYCAAEWQAVLAQDPLNRRSKLIVLRIEECRPSGLLSALAYWDLVPIRGDATLTEDVTLRAVGALASDSGVTQPIEWHAPAPLLHEKIRPQTFLVGRDEALAALQSAFAALDAQDAAARVVAVTGLPGVGKSVLAHHYGWLHRSRYAGIWSLAAEHRDGIVDGLIAVGSHFIPGLANAHDRALAARRSLEFIGYAGIESPWLLIYDNAESPAALEGMLPQQVFMSW